MPEYIPTLGLDTLPRDEEPPRCLDCEKANRSHTISWRDNQVLCSEPLRYRNECSACGNYWNKFTPYYIVWPKIVPPDDSDIIIDHAEGYIEIKNHTRKKRFYLKLEEVPYE